ncbi:hypothetical protein [Lysinibacillus xylanilyticus]|uniref:PepSY domain-containing protein n=1 Tax=Lysinibacillus xylanilyticus TaxID=582475 RepID=A0A2M9QAV6_9BACI|nr:hypothetical protein [Lysinibacillus xylanilyticus]PJO45194.1 hypothetical protein CWD94_03980 [Lysinibacillus xylanilyticus]
MVSFIKKLVCSILIFSSLFLNLETIESNAAENLENSNTCTVKKDIMESKNVKGFERESYIKEALNATRVQIAIETAEEQGYSLEENSIEVKRIFPIDQEPQVNVAFMLSKSQDNYQIVLYNSQGLTNVIDVNDGEVNMNYSLQEEPTPRILCITCSTVCVGLIGNPPAFLSCLALCVVACGA